MRYSQLVEKLAEHLFMDYPQYAGTGSGPVIHWNDCRNQEVWRDKAIKIISIIESSHSGRTESNEEITHREHS